MKINQRAERIDMICRTIEKAFADGRDIDKEQLISIVMKKYFCSRRVTLEYLQACLSEYKTKEEKVDGIILIKNLRSKK